MFTTCGGGASAGHLSSTTVGIQRFMSELYIVDWNGDVVSGHYEQNKYISVVTGVARYSSGDHYVNPFVGCFDESMVGKTVHVEMSKSLGFGTSFNAQVYSKSGWDLGGKYLNMNAITIAKSVASSNLSSINGTYEVAISYNNQVKKFILIIKA